MFFPRRALPAAFIRANFSRPFFNAASCFAVGIFIRTQINSLDAGVVVDVGHVHVDAAPWAFHDLLRALDLEGALFLTWVMAHWMQIVGASHSHPMTFHWSLGTLSRQQLRHFLQIGVAHIPQISRFAALALRLFWRLLAFRRAFLESPGIFKTSSD